jgi:hypothetical protein
MDNHIVTGAISWFLPGVGHLIQGRLKRGLIIGAVIWIMFIVGVVSGGAYYPGFGFKDGSLLYLLNIFAKLGNGLGAIVTMILAADPPKDVAAWGTFEYGGRFIEIAGLLNYLAMLDAVDIRLGRKK